MGNITSANSSFSLIVTDLYPTAQSIQGYAADDAFVSDAQDFTEFLMGVDGGASAGFIFTPTEMNVSLQADSDSLIIFETWWQTMQTARNPYMATATITLPAISRRYTLKDGVLRNGPKVPGARRVLAPLVYRVTWGQVTFEQY